MHEIEFSSDFVPTDILTSEDMENTPLRSRM